MNNMQGYVEQFYALAMLYGPKLLLAIITLVIGLWVIRIVLRVFDKAMTRAEMEVSLQKFLGSLAGILLKALLLISVASMVGIATTSFVAILGAAGLAVGLALQGSLANFAGGVLILLFKPFKVGDVIDAQGYLGKVNAIQVFQTILKTPDNKTIIIPNGPLSNGSITNFSTEPTRRVDMVFGIGYDDNIADAKRTLQNLVDADTRIMKEPAPQIVLGELGDSSVNFYVRVWCNSADYWNIYFDTHEKVKQTFDAEGISIPFPQRDVHLYKHED
ncbi:MAG: mechanosensitive ion channel [Calditrichaeota bacterium]|nr:mechanosensitive ion channel [Calditrichota bacterium]MCB9086963.1 mechanosensitive ion channel [Calditrichia bacterium]MCB0292367.1 mechanosensitive ion channel [Calditrichota bacterium]MCB0294039.1 mechanosensitive ion channel [Calditrichota bacterium]MCB0305879.1 mechanosensitive ion channel [Calditrichota bacterium]